MGTSSPCKCLLNNPKTICDSTTSPYKHPINHRKTICESTYKTSCPYQCTLNHPKTICKSTNPTPHPSNNPLHKTSTETQNFHSLHNKTFCVLYKAPIESTNNIQTTLEKSDRTHSPPHKTSSQPNQKTANHWNK